MDAAGRQVSGAETTVGLSNGVAASWTKGNSSDRDCSMVGVRGFDPGDPRL